MAHKPLAEVEQREVRGVRLQKIGNSRGVIIPSEWIAAIGTSDGTADGPVILDMRIEDHPSLPQIRISRGWRMEDRDEEWARETGRRAFIEFYARLGIHPGMTSEEQIEAARMAHGESAPWEHVRAFYGDKNLKTEIRHSCIDREAGETDADAELNGCTGEEFCGWHLAKGKIPDIVNETFYAEAKRCWPDEEVREQILHPDY